MKQPLWNLSPCEQRMNAAQPGHAADMVIQLTIPAASDISHSHVYAAQEVHATQADLAVQSNCNWVNYMILVLRS